MEEKAFLDADTIVSPHAIKTIKDQLEKGSFIGTLHAKPDQKKIFLFLYCFIKNTMNTFYPWANGILFCRKEDFYKTGGFNPARKQGEWREFYKQIKKYSTYKKIKMSYVITSSRRIQARGIKNMLLFWLFTKKREYVPIR